AGAARRERVRRPRARGPPRSPPSRRARARRRRRASQRQHTPAPAPLNRAARAGGDVLTDVVSRSTAWRGDRVVEGARLLSVCRGSTPTEGSNPSLSAEIRATSCGLAGGGRKGSG